MNHVLLARSAAVCALGAALQLVCACSAESKGAPSWDREEPRAKRSALVLGLNPACTGASKPVVSITFDDGLDKHETGTRDGYMDISWHAENTLLADAQQGAAATDLLATFYANRPRVAHSIPAESSTSDGISAARLRRLDALGHEIGGHTAHHVLLPRQVVESTAEIEREVCWDRNQLSSILKEGQTNEYLKIFSFAYPFGEYKTTGHNWTIPDIVGRNPSKCGHYESGRATGGVADFVAASVNCTDMNPSTTCPWAEAISTSGAPMSNDARFTIRTPASVRYDTKLEYCATPSADAACTQSIDDGDGVYDTAAEFESRAKTIKGWVANAVENGCPTGKRWWLVLVFHRICKDSGCVLPRDEYGIRDSEFVALVEWLRALVDAGVIDVKTVHRVFSPDSDTAGQIVAPPARAARAVVENAAMNDCVVPTACDDESPPNKDLFPDRFQAGKSASVRVEDDQGNSVARMTVPQNKQGEFFVAWDLNTAALKVVAPTDSVTQRNYRVSFRHRMNSGSSPQNGFKFKGALRTTYENGGGVPNGVPSQEADAFWSSATVTASLAGPSEMTFTPTSTWETVRGYVNVPYSANVNKRKDAMSFGIATNVTDSSEQLEVDVDDFEFCVCGATSVGGVPACGTTDACS